MIVPLPELFSYLFVYCCFLVFFFVFFFVICVLFVFLWFVFFFMICVLKTERKKDRESGYFTSESDNLNISCGFLKTCGLLMEY